MKVLIADDHFLIRQSVHNALKKFKITNVQTAADGNEAIARVQRARAARQPYDIVFLDWHMPMISGLEVLSYFRAEAEYADTAFVMLTAESEQQNIMKAIKAGATSYIAKPVSPTDLGKKLLQIHDWLKHERLVDGRDPRTADQHALFSDKYTGLANHCAEALPVIVSSSIWVILPFLK